MDLDVDPCDDFYKFSCGNYIRETLIPDDKKKWTSFSPLEEISMNCINMNLQSVKAMSLSCHIVKKFG